MRSPCVRFTIRRMIILALGVTAMTAASLAAPRLSPAQANPPAKITLLGILSEWKYPGSDMPGGATISDGGIPGVQSVKCAAVLTTPDPIEKVIGYYAEKFGTGGSPERQAEKGEAKSVSVQDDSQGRPVTLRVLVVNEADTSTTLVMSRAEGEKETHIAWSHYRRFDAAGK